MFITPEIAIAHLRLTADDIDSDIMLKADAAEQVAIGYLDRAVYENQVQLGAAIAQVPAALADAKAAYAAAGEAAGLIADRELCLIEKTYAFDLYLNTKFDAARIRRGLVINSSILSAMLLILGDLWESREDTVVGASVTRLPNGARCLLDAYRYHV